MIHDFFLLGLESRSLFSGSQYSKHDIRKLNWRLIKGVSHMNRKSAVSPFPVVHVSRSV